MRDINKLHPRLIQKLNLLKEAAKKAGLKIGIGECVRTAAEQDKLYAKGRTTEGEIVTNAKGSTYSSMHQWGVAFDFYRDDGKGIYEDKDGFFKKVGKIGKELGLVWGGDWKSLPDKPHFQMPDFGDDTKALKKQYKTPKKFFASWEEEEMTLEEKQKVEELENRIEILEKEKEKVYHYTAELPSWARPTVQKLLDMGIYQGESESDLNLPESLMRTLVINDRANLYKKG